MAPEQISAKQSSNPTQREQAALTQTRDADRLVLPSGARARFTGKGTIPALADTRKVLIAACSRCKARTLMFDRLRVCSLPQLAAAKVSKSGFRSKQRKFRRHFKGLF